MNNIDRINGQDAARLYLQNTDTARAAAASAAQHSGKAQQRAYAHNVDSVTLSDNARSMVAAREAVQNAPDVRESKVADIKQQVDSGTYQVSARVLARNLVAAYSANDQA
jgi:negative regulator of flagellin synthesis FlgM